MPVDAAEEEDSIEKINTDLPSDIIKNKVELFPSNSDNNCK